MVKMFTHLNYCVCDHTIHLQYKPKPLVMFTKLFLTSWIVLLFSAGSNNQILDCHTESTSESIVTKAVVYQGEVIPAIELHEVQINGKYNRNALVTAEVVDGEIVPVVELDELVITPTL